MVLSMNFAWEFKIITNKGHFRLILGHQWVKFCPKWSKYSLLSLDSQMRPFFSMIHGTWYELWMKIEILVFMSQYGHILL